MMFKQTKGEKRLLVFFILTVLFFLTFSNSTFKGTLPVTGAVFSIDLVEDANYIVSITIALVLLGVIIYFAYTFRRQKSSLWHLEPSEEEKALLIEKKIERKSLENKLEELNKELEELKKTVPISRKAPFKKTRNLSVNQKFLEEDLRDVNAKLYGNRKPQVISEPKRKAGLEINLARIENNLSNLDKMPIKKTRIITKIGIPTEIESINKAEESRFQEELKDISSTLSGKKKKRNFFKIKTFGLRKKVLKKAEKEAWKDLQKIEQKIEGEKPQRNELFKIEEEILKLKKQIRKDIQENKR
ncbi:MAG: hypothetical protein KKA62_00030 [Nanoarchaeota archaeon]|nr:hypothetical protein [Nanoarchaeota archaeon]MBU1976324.1 hypothetical protein [Nanoarchaeota archaeon]